MFIIHPECQSVSMNDVFRWEKNNIDVLFTHHHCNKCVYLYKYNLQVCNRKKKSFESLKPLHTYENHSKIKLRPILFISETYHYDQTI